MIRKLTLWSFVFCAALAANVHALSDLQVEESIQVLISNRHPSDTAATWRGLGANAPKVIISIYQKTENTYHRMRLLHGLGWFDEPSAVDFLKLQAQETDQDVIRNQAIRAVGTSQGSKETDFVAKFLSNKDPQTRITAAETLKAMRDARAEQLVDQYLAAEKVSWVVQKIKGQVTAPPLSLKPVSISEDRLNSQFIGNWKGYWILPATARDSQARGMTSAQAIFRVEANSAQEISGDLTIQSKSKAQIWILKNVEGKASRLKGLLTERPVQGKPGQKPQEVSFEADLTEESETPLIRLRVSRLGATLVVRKTQ